MPTPQKNSSEQSCSPEEKAIPVAWLEEFEAAARRPLATRMKYAFIRTYKPVLDDEPFRVFDTMEDYRRWCNATFSAALGIWLPDWLGYGRV